MKEDLILQKYTRALFEVADEQNALEEVQKDLQGMKISFGEIPELGEFLVSPQVEWAKKVQLTDTLTRGSSSFVVNFVKLVMEKERQFILPHLAGEFQRLLDLRAKRKEAVVTTVIPLPENERKLLEDKLKTLFEEDFVLENDVDPTIIGGIKVRMGFTVIDGSVKRKLEEMGRLLARG